MPDAIPARETATTPTAVEASGTVTMPAPVIDRLETAGLVHRERDPADRRRYALRISRDGRTTLERMREAGRQADRTLTASLPTAGQRSLNEFLRRIATEEPGTLPESLTSQTGFLLGRASRRLRGEREKAMRRLCLEPGTHRAWSAGTATPPTAASTS